LIPVYETLRKQTGLALCASHGFITHNQALLLKSCGVTRYHHNLETSTSFFKRVCTTHSYFDRVRTIDRARSAGLEICSGGIIGMGESNAERIQLARELGELGPVSIAINILTPIPGTPMERSPTISVGEIIDTLPLFRQHNETADIRLAGGRHRFPEGAVTLQDSGISSLMTGNYLTTSGNSVEKDIRYIEKCGLVLR
jgi:biotin synthase